jgi:hypothetical protein
MAAVFSCSGEHDSVVEDDVADWRIGDSERIELDNGNFCRESMVIEASFLKSDCLRYKSTHMPSLLFTVRVGLEHAL